MTLKKYCAPIRDTPVDQIDTQGVFGFSPRCGPRRPRPPHASSPPQTVFRLWRVLAGQIRRGMGETIRAVLWLSDLRGFTSLSESLPRDELISGAVEQRPMSAYGATEPHRATPDRAGRQRGAARPRFAQPHPKRTLTRGLETLARRRWRAGRASG